MVVPVVPARTHRPCLPGRVWLMVQSYRATLGGTNPAFTLVMSTSKATGKAVKGASHKLPARDPLGRFVKSPKSAAVGVFADTGAWKARDAAADAAAGRLVRGILAEAELADMAMDFEITVVESALAPISSEDACELLAERPLSKRAAPARGPSQTWMSPRVTSWRANLVSIAAIVGIALGAVAYVAYV